MFKLVIQDDEGKTTVVPLIRDEITIGRKEGNTIRLTERNVSRKHARIVRANGAVAIEDLGSYNGVRVNGTRISQRTPLTISDRVQIGDYLIELKAEGAELGAAPAGYDDAKTQPVERIDPNYARGQTPIPGMASAPGMAPHGMGVPPPQMMMPGQPGVQMVGDPASTLVALSDTDPRMPQARSPVVAPHGGMGIAPTVSGHARLVILSSNFAGREFELIKPQMVIGRTDDNDVVVNHRSISRNHAKVVREPETGRYTIMDLQSSNGVRVNGEEYGKVELRRGDIVDLGHVRMRFVEAGEDFLFGRDAHVVDVPTSGGKGLWIALAALLVVGGIVGIVIATRGSGDDAKDTAANSTEGPQTSPGKATDPATDKAAESGTQDGSQVVASTTPDAPVSDTPPSNDKKLNQLKQDVTRAIEQEKWTDVVALCKDVQAIVADDADCASKIEFAKRMEGAALKFGDFNDAVGAKDYPKVAETFREIDPDSVYKARAAPAHDKLRDEYVAKKKAAAAKLGKAGKCDDIDTLVAEASKVWSEAADAVRAEATKCAKVAVKEEKKEKDPKEVKEKEPKEKEPKETPEESGKTGEEYLAEAQQAAKAGQYGKALRSAQKALDKKPGNQDALMTAAIAACNLKKGDVAKKYIGKLATSRQGMARQICLRNNVEI